MLRRLIALVQTLPKTGGDAGDPVVAQVLQALKDFPAEQLGRPVVTVTRRPKVSFCSLYEDDDVTVGVFVLDKGACIPLHNHPKMMVLSRVLSGNLHLRSYDFDSGPAGTPPPSPRALVMGSAHVARLRRDEVLPSQSIFSLFEHDGNIHSLSAPVERVTVLEVLRPSYTEGTDSDRPCTYFRCEPVSVRAASASAESDLDAVASAGAAGVTTSDSADGAIRPGGAYGFPGGGSLLRRFLSPQPAPADSEASMLGGRAFGDRVRLRVVEEPAWLEIVRAQLSPPPPSPSPPP